MLDPFTRGAITRVLDTWTATWNRRFSGGSQPSQGWGSRSGLPRLEPDGWLVRIPAPEHGENGRATRVWIGSPDLSPAHPPGDSREKGEVWGVDKSLLMGGTIRHPELVAGIEARAATTGR